MSITVIFPATNMTEEKYREVLRRLEAAGAGSPPGREFHACFGTSDSLGVVDVWTTPEQFEAFGQTLGPILAEVGVEEAEPQIAKTLNVIA